jgi:TrmH family RNA methyltransferase
MKDLFKKNIFVILSRPSTSENIGLVARGMKNTGFENLRLILNQPLKSQAFKTAVHSEEILRNASVYSCLPEAVEDLHVVFAAVARHRKNFPSLKFEDAVKEMMTFSSEVKIGLVFGNERSGLVSEELRYSNVRFSIPQAKDQPSYNLASAVLLTLFQLFMRGCSQRRSKGVPRPISRKDQEQCIQLIIEKLKDKNFIHVSNQVHVMDRIYDLFGRLKMNDRDRRLLLAVFSKGVDQKNRP